MSISPAALAAVLAFFFSLSAFAGQFRYGLNRSENLNAKLPNLPAVRIGRATLAIDVKEAMAPGQSGVPMGNGAPVDTSSPATLLQAALDQAFRESFTIVQANGDAFMRVAITHYTPAESRIDTLTQKTRVPQMNPDGTPQIDPNTGRQMTVETPMQVEQWVARGQIALRVEVVDSTGVLLDGFAPQASVNGTQVISVNGEDRVDRTQIPTLDQVKAKLMTDLVNQLQPRYAPAAEAVEIPLAVDEELRPGNKLAKEGDFEGALKSWQAAAMKKPENEADRIHNLGAIYETEAYDRLLKQAPVDQVGPYLDRAAKQYTEAAAADPKEKYFTRANERIRKARLRLGRIADLEAARQRTLTARANPSPWPPGSPATPLPPAPVPVAPTPEPTPVPVTPVAPPTPDPAPAPTPAPAPVEPAPAAADPALQEALDQVLNDPRPDSPQEAVFRQFIRLRLRSSAAAPTPEVQRQLEPIGAAAYSLTALQSRRVIHQESKTWTAMQPKLGIYRESYTAFATDGKISPEERTALQSMAKNLGLSPEDVKTIESAIKLPE